MKLPLTNIRKLKSESDNKLTKHVCSYVINKWHDYDNKINIFKDVLYISPTQKPGLLNEISVFVVWG